MCFSAAASFTTAVVLGAAGAACLSRARRPGETMLAAMPGLFAVQQAVEGLIWLQLHHQPAVGGLMPLVFLIFAQALWPAWAPLAALLAEPSPARRRLMWPIVGLGWLLAVWLLWRLMARTHVAELLDGRIAYDAASGPPFLIGFPYLAAIVLPLALSSHRAVVALGLIVLAGSAVAFTAYYQSYQSVWCFFAAAGSVVILGHFRSLRPLTSASA